MTLEAKLKARYKEDLDDVDDVYELILDELVTIDKISESDKKFLERFSNLTYLSFNLLGLTSVQNLPSIKSLQIVIIHFRTKIDRA